MLFRKREPGDDPYIALRCDKCGAVLKYHRGVLRLERIEHDECREQPRGNMLVVEPPSEETNDDE